MRLFCFNTFFGLEIGTEIQETYIFSQSYQVLLAQPKILKNARVITVGIRDGIKFKWTKIEQDYNRTRRELKEY